MGSGILSTHSEAQYSNGTDWYQKLLVSKILIAGSEIHRLFLGLIVLSEKFSKVLFLCMYLSKHLLKNDLN